MEKKFNTGWIIPLVFVAGIAGAALRTIELMLAFEKDTGLAIPSHPASIAMAVFSAASILAFIIFSSGLNVMKPQGYFDAFSFRSAGMGGLLVFSALLLILGSALTAAQVLASGWSKDEIAPNILNLVTIALGIYSAVSVVIMSRQLSKKRSSGEYMFFELVPVFWVCFWLITTFMARASDPVILDYAYELFSIISLLLFFYYAAGFTFSSPSPKKALFCACSAIYFCMAHAFGALANTVFVKNSLELYTVGNLLIYMFAILYVAVMSVSLLSNLRFKDPGAS